MNRTDPVAVVSEALPMTLGELADQINAEHERAEASARASIKHAKTAGDLLVIAKRQVGHGNWLTWVSDNCHVSERTCRTYMKIAGQWDEILKNGSASDLSIREGLTLLADDTTAVEGLTSEGQMALDHGWIDAETAKHLLRLACYDRLATCPCVVKDSWTDLQVKKILWRPCYARSEKQIAFEVDSMLYDLWVMEEDFDRLPPAEAEQKCSAALKEPGRDEKGLAPEYYWAFLWKWMRPDYTRLTDEHRLMIEQATERYELEADRRGLDGDGDAGPRQPELFSEVY